ncbi:MAG: DUF4954 family protein [Muribaculaceae bacterium]|nr:DUF4954 family protein [Muribaculaceae bacterium]
MQYRSLSAGEVTALEAAGCSCEDWSRVLVHPDFSPAPLHNVRFSGDIRLSTFNRRFALPGGLEVSAGISDATLHNCTVGADVYIRRVSNYIANCDIEEDVFIENVGYILATGDSTFGIGTDVSVLNETGGREVPAYERLSAQIAWLLAMYRHRPEFVNTVRGMIKAHAENCRTPRATIGKGARIVNTPEIRNVRIGAHASIEGASRLNDGTIAASEVAPVRIGSGVIADHFVVASGACIEDGAVVLNCFIGQACHLTHLFSAHDSLFFANCACENGEACAIFAGPYTVTMHKSSLLIAGLFSFLNAGSGSNQSNHMYKLGPLHQGVAERGSKTTSDSYILWPARIGAFSLVMGRHVNHPDTSLLPFSYLIENRGTTFLVPGVNLKSVGTVRDAQKWPKRDKRHPDEKRLDAINFNLLSPYTARKMLLGIDLLNTIECTEGVSSDHFSYCGMTIEARALRKGRDYYRIALDKFFGNSLLTRLKDLENPTDEKIREKLRPTHAAGKGQWLDLAGMFAPQTEVDRLCDEVENGTLSSLEAIEERIHSLAADYYDMEWTWVSENFEAWAGKDISEVTVEDVLALTDRWENSVITLDKMLHEDARKEFSLSSSTGFGADCRHETRAEDFRQVRGEFEKDGFVCMVRKHIESKSAIATDLRRRFGK